MTTEADGLTGRWKDRARLRQVLGLFLKLGTISFGGPAAHIALMETEAVRRRNWLTREHFLDLLSTTNLVPGPNATEMAIYIGYVRAGWPGLVVAGAAFILPAAVLSAGIGWLYARYGSLPQARAILWGINPAIIAIVLASCYRLGKGAFQDWKLALLGAASLAAALLGVDQAVALIAAGLVGVVLYSGWRPGAKALAGLLLPGISTGLTVSPDGGSRLLRLGLFFLKVGSLLFGSGLVLFAFIQRDVVLGYHWLTQSQLVDAIAVGQMTPGPVLSSCTFIGYLVAGWPGALVATVAVFLPSFIIMTIVAAYLPRLRTWKPAQGFLKGVSAAAVALILVVALDLGRSAIVDVWTVLIALTSLALLLRLKAQTWWLVAGGAALGVIRMLVAG